MKGLKLVEAVSDGPSGSAAAIDGREAFAPGARVCAVARRVEVVPAQIYRWRQELRAATPGFAEVVVSGEPGSGVAACGPALEIEFGGDIRVRIAATAPRELACAVVRALAGR